MEPDGSDARFVVSVDDISDVWGTLKPILEARTGWKNLQLRNRVSGYVSIPELKVRYMLSSNSRLQQLRQNSQSPVTWFRNPYVQLILVSSEDTDEYKKMIKPQLKQAIDVDKDMLGGAPELVIGCLQPSSSDVNAKAAKKVYELVRSDIGTRKRERVVRIETGPRGAVSPASINELEKQMAEALKLTFSIRQAAYDDAVRKLTSERQTAGWEFGNLFLVKDSLAVMLESAGLLDDALREYAELDALYNTTLPPMGSSHSPPFGASSPGDDTAQLVRATWREARKTVWRNNELMQFDFQQFLFACQARILLKLNKPAEVAERGIAAIEGLQNAMSHPSIANKLPGLFKEAWIFSACISLANTTVRIGPPPPTPKSRPPLHTRTVSLPASGQQKPSPTNHRRTISETQTDAKGSGKGLARQTKSLNAHFATISEDRKGEGSGRSASEADSEEDNASQDRRLESADRGISLESTTALQRAKLKPVKTRVNDTMETNMQDATPNGVRNQLGQSSPATSDYQSSISLEPSTDWQLGVQGVLGADGLSDFAGEHAQVSQSKSNRQQVFWILLGHLYSQARNALSAFNDALEFPPSVASTPQGTVDGSQDSTSPLPARSPLRTGPSLGHILPSLDTLTGLHGIQSIESRDSSLAPSSVDTSKSQALADVKGVESSAAPQGSQHFRTLSRFAREAHMRANSASSLFMHSRKPSAASDVPSSAMSEAESVGSLLQRESDGSAQPEVLLRNVRVVERDVETASESSGSPSSAKMSDRLGITKSKFGWLTEWRIRTALSSEDKYQELWIELSGAAAACYGAAGWHRQAHQMLAGVADVLVQKGHLQMAISLLHTVTNHLRSEHWLALSAHLHHLQLLCYHRLGQAANPEDCLRLLGICISQKNSKLLSLSQNAFLESVKSAPNEDSPRAVLSNPKVFWVEPIGTHHSRFFGQSQESGEPITAPSMRPPCEGVQAGQGAQQACVGDILTLCIVAHSNLTDSVQVSHCQLALSILQEVSVVLSPRAASSQDILLGRGQGHLRSMSVRSIQSVDLQSRGLKDVRQSTSATGSLASLNNVETSSSQRFGSRWQTTAEILCKHVGRDDSEAQHAEDDEVWLNPGKNVLYFKVTPLKSGLYAIKNLSVRLGSIELKLPAVLSNPCNPDATEFQQVKGTLGSCNMQGRLEEEGVLLEVKSISQRVKTSTVLPHSALIAGMKQWMGITISPLHDKLEKAMVHIQPLSVSDKGLGTSDHVGLKYQENEVAYVAPSEVHGIVDRFPWQRSEGQEPSTSSRDDGQSPKPQPWKRDSSNSAQLPDWAQAQPSVLWLPIKTGDLHGQQQKVRVTSYGSHIPLRALQNAQELASPVTSPVRSSDTEALKTGQAKGTAQVDVNIEYVSGCHRGSSNRLSLPVFAALRIHVTGKELPGHNVALHVSFTSNLSSPLTVDSVSLDPQPGFTYNADILNTTGLLPLEIPAHGSASVLLLLSVAGNQIKDSDSKRNSGRLQSILEIAYKACLDRPPSTAYREASENGHAALNESSKSKRGMEQVERVSQRQEFVLDLGAANAAPLGTVYIRLLGPSSARAGEAVTFCWRLERSPNFVASKGDSDVLQYNLKIEGEGWREAGERSGFVRLSLEAGSVATVEATWTSHTPGMLSMPQFLLPDVPHQEVFDVGDATHVFTVN